jgi:acetyl-CoA C-acetyltransferase
MLTDWSITPTARSSTLPDGFTDTALMPKEAPEMPEAVIVDTVRTPIGRAFKGSLAQLRPEEMGAFVVDRLLERNPELDPALIEDVFCGVGMPQGLQAFNMGRIIALLSEKLPETVNGVTISRYCSSSLDAIRHAGNAIKAGEGDAYLAVGVEWVSRYNERTEAAGVDDRDQNLLGTDGHPNAYIDMGLTAVNVANRYGVKREDMDKFAQRSQELAVKSQQDGYFDREIVPVTLPDGTEVSKDDGPRASSTLEKLAELPEAFGGGGVTAGNSCPLNDGAAAVLIMSDTKAKELGLKPRARIVTAATFGNEPEYMGVAPIGAIKKVLDRAGMTIDNVDVVELNEAFAAQVIPIMDECGIAEDKLNTHGGAIALGHPFGMTGARIMGTLLNAMETDDHQVGLETMCVAGGQGKAMIVERV